MVQVVLDVIGEDLVKHFAFETDFEDSDYFLRVLNVKDWVVNNVLEEVVGY